MPRSEFAVLLPLFNQLLTADTPDAIVRTLARLLAPQGVTGASIRAGTEMSRPSTLASMMRPDWIAYYLHQGYAEIDPGPRVAATAVEPSAICFSDDHPSFTWTGRLRAMGHELRDMDIGGAVLVPLNPLPGERYSAITFFTPERPRSFDAWRAEIQPTLEIAAAMAQSRLRRVQPTPASATALSEREAMILASLAGGERLEGISWQLGISVRTAKFHAFNARRKLGARTRDHAIALALHYGLIHL